VLTWIEEERCGWVERPLVQNSHLTSKGVIWGSFEDNLGIPSLKKENNYFQMLQTIINLFPMAPNPNSIHLPKNVFESWFINSIPKSPSRSQSHAWIPCPSPSHSQ
jgi:hypothetical protein